MNTSETNSIGKQSYVLAFDTANEVISLALGLLRPKEHGVELVAHRQIAAHRASNTQLLPNIDALLEEQGIARDQIACVACGRGPGSFTGVRICIATAKGIASALEVPLVGVSTLDALAWELQAAGVRGRTLVVADAMRKEVYPQVYEITDNAIGRSSVDTVVAAEVFVSKPSDGTPTPPPRDPAVDGGGDAVPSEGPSAARACALVRSGSSLHLEEIASQSSRDGVSKPSDGTPAPPPSRVVLVAGDALAKYADAFAALGPLAPEEMWRVQGPGLLAALQAAWRLGECDPLDAQHHDPAVLLPVYTRLSDAEENERKKLADTAPKNLRTGVRDVSQAEKDVGGPYGENLSSSVQFRPFAADDIDQAAALEAASLGTDAWQAAMFADELPRKDRSWWAALDDQGALLAYAGGQIIDGQLQLFKVVCVPEARRCGIGRELLSRLAEDARNLGATEITLEVRVSNEGAQAFYEALGMKTIGVRPRYYSDGEDAAIMSGPLPGSQSDVAGMSLITGQATSRQQHTSGTHPLILALETSCDETAAAVVDGSGAILADTVASQIDFHARFGGVVPEIASRKHIEAICGVAQVCLEQVGGVRYKDLDAIACTYAPGLVGALVVGVAFAKGAAWAAGIPYIQVNHLEGHLYANKLATPDIQPPMVVSLVSGGHTMLVHVRNWGSYEILGSTIDDAVGEAFDKVAKALGLGYPGGPIISRYAEQGNPAAIDFPRAMLHSHDLRFSLSGLKTAVITHINQVRDAGEKPHIPDIAASFQAAVIDVQIAKAKTALEQTGAREFCLGGGVAANPALRAAYEKLCARMNVRLTLPPLSACTDNAAMIALVAADRYQQEQFAPLAADAQAHTNLEDPY